MAVITGSSKRDNLVGTDEADFIYDHASSTGGWDLANDWLSGGAGDDLLVATGGDDTLSGGDGDDLLICRIWGEDRLDGGAGLDTALIDRSALAKSLTFRLDVRGVSVLIGDNTSVVGIERLQFTGGGGEDRITGGALDDTLVGLAANDRLNGRGGDDRLEGGNFMDRLRGGDGHDRLTGGNEGDRLDGGSGDDVISGDAGDDRVVGGAGADVLTGSSGNDLLAGGEGADVFAIANRIDGAVVQAGPGGDTILDFEDGTDRIDLTRVTDASGARLIEDIGDLLVQQRGADVLIRIDRDGNGRADSIDFNADGVADTFAIRLINVERSSLDTTDFIFGQPPAGTPFFAELGV